MLVGPSPIIPNFSPTNRLPSFQPARTANPLPAPASCPPGVHLTPTGCIYPEGTIATFRATKRKWQIAIPRAALPSSPSPSGPAQTLAPGGFGDPTFVVVAEDDTPPANARQVDETTFDAATTEATPATEPTPAASSTPEPQPAPPAASTPPAPAPTVPENPALPTIVEPSVPVPAPGLRFQGCISRFNTTRKVFVVYCRAQPSLAGWSGNAPNAVDTNNVTPPPPTGFVKQGEFATQPGEGETPAGHERDKFFRLKNPLMWITIFGTAAVLGGGSYVLYRRRRA